MDKSIEQMPVVELRKEAARRGLGSGVWRAGAGRDALLSVLRGESSPELIAGPAVAVGADAAPVAAPAPGGLDAMLAAAIEPHLRGRTISRAEFDRLADAWVKQNGELDDLRGRVAELEKGNGGAVGQVPASVPQVLEGPAIKRERIKAKLAHCQLGQVAAWVSAGVPLWLWGGAGCGKTFLARQVADELALECFIISIDPTTTTGKLLGFRSLAGGEFVPGFLYHPFKFGGLVMLDEIDTGDAGILAALNALLANDSYLFPNGETVARHPDFRVVAGANTRGAGASGGYSARNRLDAATLDRFALVELKADNGLEMALVLGGPSDTAPWKGGEPLSVHTAPAVCKRWVEYVQKARAKATAVLISPRASILGAAGLRAGIPAAEVADAVLFKLCDADTKRSILGACGQP